MSDSKCLLTAIRRSNDERLEWCRSGPARIVGLLSESVAHWNSLGVTDSDSLDKFLFEQESRHLLEAAEELDLEYDEPDLDYDSLS